MPKTKALFAAVLLSLASSIAAVPAALAADGLLVIKPSNHSVKDTLNKLTGILSRKGIRVIALIDHAAGAKKVGLKLPPTQLLIFGNPKMGTPLMLSKRTMGLELPMKVLAYQDDKGKVWLAYTRPDVLKQRNGITNRDPLFAKMTKVLDKITDKAAQ